MSLAATTIWEVEAGGSDTLNGGAFDPGQTAGMFTDGAATVATGNAPVFTSASYNFVAGDVGAWVFIASGSNWTPGWYKIASVAANAATLNGTIGAAVIGPTTTVSPSTVAGCATVASPTAATWSIDYSQQAAAQFAYTDLASAGAGLTVSSAAKPFAKQQVGNSLVITGGTNFTAGRYVIASVAAAVATVVGPGNITSGVGASGTGGQGGALASPGQVGASMVAGNVMCVLAGTYTISSATQNISGGCFLGPGGGFAEGYQTVRGDLGTPPLLQASGISTFTLVSWTSSANGYATVNLKADGASLTSSRGFAIRGYGYKLTGINCTNSALAAVSTTELVKCSATGCATQPAFGGSAELYCLGCEAYTNTITGFGATGASKYIDCLSYNNSGASSDGFAMALAGLAVNCTTYGNGRDGIRCATIVQVLVANCIGESNTGLGFQDTGGGVLFVNCAGYLNTGGNISAASGLFTKKYGFITGSASFFTNAAGGDFSLNTTAGGGALLRAAGYPGVFPAGTTTGYLDIGAAQSAAAAASGGSAVAIFGG